MKQYKTLDMNDGRGGEHIQTHARPLWIISTPFRFRKHVDFPAPLDPSTAIRSPFLTDKFTSCRAAFLLS